MKKQLSLILMLLLLAGCASKRAVAPADNTNDNSKSRNLEDSIARNLENSTTRDLEEIVLPVGPLNWHSCYTTAKVVATLNEQTIQASCVMQGVKDSMLIISIMPLPGIELLRLEATPRGIVGVDKINHEYLEADYETINQYVFPEVRWEDLQQAITGTAQGEEAMLGYGMGKYTAMLRITNAQRQWNRSMRMQSLDKSRYKALSLTSLIKGAK